MTLPQPMTEASYVDLDQARAADLRHSAMPTAWQIDCAMGAGFMMTWQEDPEGLRPGQGLGPGEGWSGAVVNAQDRYLVLLHRYG